MYERSAIVLERYFENLFGFNKQYNLKENYKNYAEFLEEFEKYQECIKEEETIIKEFEEVAEEIQSLQKTQEKLSDDNAQLENERMKLFNNLDEDPSLIERKLKNIEEKVIKNNEELENLRSDFIKYIKGFSERQKERNKYTKARRIAESAHINIVKNITEYIKNIDLKDIKRLNDFYNSDNIDDKKSLTIIMSENGKNERVKFNQTVLDKAITARINFAREELQGYILIYDRTRKLLKEVENDNIKLSKYQKTIRDVTAKLNFINAEKDYIVGFLDNERMTAMNGPKVHEEMMEEACKNFDLDMIQINNLYNLLIKEITGKATKKLYKELYNNTYLKEIEEKEKKFEKEVSNINIAGTLINSNYWRLEGIKNIYKVFEYEISEKFDRDLSEFQIKEPEKDEGIQEDENQQIFAEENEKETNIKEDEDIDYEVYDYEDEDVDDKYEEDNYDDEYEYDDEEYNEDDYEEEYENDEEDSEYDDDDEYDDYEDNDDYDEDEDYEDDEYENDDDYEDEDEYDDEDDYEEDDEYDEDDYEEDEEYENDEEDDDYDDEYIENNEDEEYEKNNKTLEKHKKTLNTERHNKNIIKRNHRKNNIYEIPKVDKKHGYKNNRNAKKMEAKKDIYKDNKTGIFRNILGKMKNENK